MGTDLLSVSISTTDASILSPSNPLAARERKRIIGSLGQLWNALASAPGAKNELLNGGLSSHFFFFFFLRLYTKLKYDHNRTTIHDFNLHQYNSSTVPHDPTYNSKIAIQYHMIDNNCPLFSAACEAPFFPFCLRSTLYAR